MAVFRHKHTKVCPTAVVMNFAVDALAEARGQPVACVLMNEAEVAIFHHEATSTNAIPANQIAVPSTPDDFWTDDRGKLWLMTYPQMSFLIAQTTAVRLNGDLTLILHLGCGEYTWDIVKGCHDVWKWAHGFEVGFQKPIIWVYTVSNLEESIFRDVPAARLDLSGIMGPKFKWWQPDDLGTAMAQLHTEYMAWDELSKSTPQAPERPRHTNRAVIFAPREKLLEACNRQGCKSVAGVRLNGSMTGRQLEQWVEILRQGLFDFKAFMVGPDVGTIGTVRNLGMALVLPVREGWFFDRRVSRVVFRRDIPMSQAEVRYACRVACLPDISPPVHIFTTQDGFRKLPETPTSPRAFTGDLPAVLLHFCDHSYFGGSRTSPIRLPSDEMMIAECLRRLHMRGLTENNGGPLTHLGRLTDWWYQSGIRDSNVANLLAIAGTAQGDRAAALTQVAALFYEPSPSSMSPISSLLEFKSSECNSARFQSLLAKEVQGFAKDYVARGPIWVALGIWACQMEIMRRVDTSNAADFSTCDNMLSVSQGELVKIQKNWGTMRHMWTSGLGLPEASREPAIDERDFLFLEESIVRVWMHNLVLVSTQDSELGTFGCDLTSGCPVMAPVSDPVDWGRLTTDVDPEPDVEMPYTGVFAVYTALHRVTRPDGEIIYIPENLTYVSSRAVRHVMRDVATSVATGGQRSPNWYDILRTKYPVHGETGDGRLEGI